MLEQSEFIPGDNIFHGLIPRIMGSKFDLLTVGLPKDAAAAIWERICKAGERIDSILNSSDPDSEIGAFNAGKMLAHSAVSEELGAVIEKCRDLRSDTLGLFDVALGKMHLVDHDEEDGSLSLYGVRLDLGSFERGYFLSECNRILRDGGADCAFANFGNFAFLAIGRHPHGEKWKVSLSNPYTRMPVDEVELCDCACAMSCNAPGCAGRVIDPATLKGVEDRKMVVVTGSDPLEIKALSTALMAAGPEKAGQLVEMFPDNVYKSYNL